VFQEIQKCLSRNPSEQAG